MGYGFAKTSQERAKRRCGETPGQERRSSETAKMPERRNAKRGLSASNISDRVVAEYLKLLTDENIAFIAKLVAEECNKSPDNISVKELRKAIKEADTAIENLWRGIELGQSVEMLTERINQRKAEKAELEEQLAIEQNKKICLTEPQIHAFLDYVCDMPADDVNKRRAIINIFVHSIYLYDDYFTLIVNASKKPLSIDNIPLDDIETAFCRDTYTSDECSSMKTIRSTKKNHSCSCMGGSFSFGGIRPLRGWAALKKRAGGTFLAAKSAAAVPQGRMAQGKAAATSSLWAGKKRDKLVLEQICLFFCYSTVRGLIESTVRKFWYFP